MAPHHQAFLATSLHSIDRSSLPDPQLTFLSDEDPFDEESLTHCLAFPTRSLPRRCISIMQVLEFFSPNLAVLVLKRKKPAKYPPLTQITQLYFALLWQSHTLNPHQRLVGKWGFPGIGRQSACFTSVTRASLPVVGRHFISYAAAAPSAVFKQFSRPLLAPHDAPALHKNVDATGSSNDFGFEDDFALCCFFTKMKTR